MNINKQLGMRIRYLRKERGWSQETLSFEADINKNYISDLERGTRNPTLEILEKLSIAFNINLDELVKGLQSFK